jgi:hypothetical protein
LRWTPEEDRLLHTQVVAGITLVDIAARHARTELAIRRRITRLGLRRLDYP